MTSVATLREGLRTTGTSGSPRQMSEAQLGHLTLIAFNRALTRWSSNGALEESDGAVLCAAERGSLSSPTAPFALTTRSEALH